MARHPWRGAVLRIMLLALAAAPIASLGRVLGAPEATMLAVGFVATGSSWSLHLGALAWKLRRRPEPGLRARIAAHDPERLGLQHAPLGGLRASGAWISGLSGGFAAVASTHNMSLFLAIALCGLWLAIFLLAGLFNIRKCDAQSVCLSYAGGPVESNHFQGGIAAVLGQGTGQHGPRQPVLLRTAISS